MTKWTPEGEEAFDEGFRAGRDSVDDASGVITLMFGAVSGFLVGLIVAVIVYIITR